MERLLKMRKVNPVGFFNSMKTTVEQMTEATNGHELTPELMLRLVTPNCPLWLEKFEKCPFPDPFWAFYWPGGQALTRFLLDNKSIAEGKSVLDLGSGCGSLSIAAARFCKALQVTANDIDPISAVAIEINASLNGCKPGSITVLVDNIVGTSRSAHEFSCILLGDMFYNEEFNNKMMKWLLKFVKSGVNVFIGDPGRHLNLFEQYSTNVKQIAEYKVSEEFRKVNDLYSDRINIWEVLSKK